MSLTTQPDLRSTVARDVLVDIEQFLFEEAELLDQWRLHEWLDLFSPEGYYEVPTTDRPDGDPTRDLFLVHDDRFLLEQRVNSLLTRAAHAEYPHSATRRTISSWSTTTDSSSSSASTHSSPGPRTPSTRTRPPAG